MSHPKNKSENFGHQRHKSPVSNRTGRRLAPVIGAVRLRQKRLKNGDDSLYLDTNGMANGKRSYDFVKLYLNPPTDELAEMEHRTTLELARQIGPRPA